MSFQPCCDRGHYLGGWSNSQQAEIQMAGYVENAATAANTYLKERS